MLLLNHFQRQFAYMIWADACAWTQCIEWTVDRSARFDRELFTRFHHVHLVQRVFHDQIERGEHTVRPVEEFQSVTELLDYGEAATKDVLAMVRRFDEAFLQERVHIPWLADKGKAPVKPLVVDALTQVLLHTQHHRGQLMSRLRSFGGDPRSIDYIVWNKQERPEAKWPEAPKTQARPVG